ncbi:MAG: hypothetical protein GKR86_08560 [Ilumatobacter sp.]|nr:hypothetical protein [Ilumatobacter sp.]
MTQPRPIALVTAQVDSCLSAGRTAFEDTGIDATSGTIRQIVVSDLDGDGSLVAYSGIGFSVLLLIDADSGASLTVARDNVSVIASDTSVTTEPDSVSHQTHRTLAVADLNGDRIMEFVVHAWEATKTGVVVHSYCGAEVTAVLTTDY